MLSHLSNFKLINNHVLKPLEYCMGKITNATKWLFSCSQSINYKLPLTATCIFFLNVVHAGKGEMVFPTLINLHIPF